MGVSSSCVCRHLSVCTVSVSLLLLVFSVGQADFQQLRILATADLCCRLMPSSDFEAPGLPRRQLGGWAYLAYLVNELRTDATLVLDCGGFAFGSPEAQATQGRAAIRFMNLVGYDAAALGARDFGGGAENVEVLASLAHFSVLADPMLDVVLHRKVPLFRPFLVKEVKGVKVALIAVSDPDIPKLNRRIDTRGFAPEDPILQLRRYLAAIEPEKPDLVVVFGHLDTKAAAMLLDTFPRLDLVISPYAEGAVSDGNRLVYAGQYGQRLTVVDIMFNRTDRRTYGVQSRTMNVVPANSDSIAALLVQELRQGGMDAPGPFVKSELLAEGEDRTLGLLVAEAVRVETRADIAFIPWSSLGAGLSEGLQTKRMLFDVVPFCEPVRTVVMNETTLASLFRSTDSEQLFPALAGADLFVFDDTTAWPTIGRVARVRLRERKSQYRVTTTEQVLEVGGITNMGRLSERNLTELWIDWACAQDTLRISPRPKLYLAGPGLITASPTDSSPFPININTATATLLERLPGIGPMTAKRIVEYRGRQGRFSTVEELLNVSGIGPKKLAKIRPLVVVK